MNLKYDKLFRLLYSKGKNKNWLRNNGIHAGTVDNLVKNKPVSTEIIARICGLLECQPGDIMECVPEDKPREE